MELKAGYKQTDLGVIPEDWEIMPLQKLARLNSGFAFSSSYFSENGSIVLTPGNFKLEGGLYFNDRNTKRYSGEYSPSMVFSSGDLLIVMTDLTPDCNLLGKPAIVESNETILHNQRIAIVDPIYKGLFPNYLYFVFLSNAYLSRIKETATGSTVRHTSATSIIYNISILVPPTSEQQAVAATLSDVDTLITALDRLITKKRDIKQAAVQELLTGKRRLRGFAGGWDTVKFADVADKHIQWSITGGPFGSNLKASDYVTEGVRIIQLQNIGDGIFLDNYAIYTTEQKADELLSCNIYPGEIILSMMCDPVARACFVPEADRRYLMASDGIRLVPDKRHFDKRFVHEYINSICFRKNAIGSSTGSTRQRIGLGNLKQLPFVQPTLSEQTAIANVLSDMDAEIASLETRREKTNALKQGMMQELLNGRIRLLQGGTA